MIETIDDINLLVYLDSGCFAETYLSKKKGSNTLYATKKINLNVVAQEPFLMRFVENEIMILKEIKHPNIVKLYDVKIRKDYIYLIMEYCNGGSLLKALNIYMEKNRKPFTEDIVKHLMKQILSAVECLHKHQIIHRDLKLENILLNFNSAKEANISNILASQVKIIDFDISIRARGYNRHMNRGSFIVDDNNVYDEKDDIMALGIICYQMLYGKNLYSHGNKNQNLKSEYINSKPYISQISKSFLACMLNNDSNQRLSATELLNHDYFKNYTYGNNTNYSKNSHIIINNRIHYYNNILNHNNVNNILNHPTYLHKFRDSFVQKPQVDESFRKTDYIKQPTFKIYSIGKGINNVQANIIINCCRKCYIQTKGGLMTAKKSAELIKGLLGSNWLILISYLNCQQFDFNISAAKAGDYIVFSLDRRLFQICRY